MHKSKYNLLFDKWNQFAPKIIPFMATGIKDGNSKVLFQRLLEVQDSDLSNIFTLIIVILLISYLK